MDTPFSNAVPNNDELYTRVIELGNHKLGLRTLIFTNQSDEKGVVLRHQKSSYMSSKWAYKDLPRLPVQALIHNGYSDPYEPGTKRERAYMAAISSIYQDDCIEDAALLLAIQ